MANVANWYLIVRGRDHWSDATLDRLEAMARGRIIWCGDDGAGNATWSIRPRVRPRKADRKSVLDAFAAIGVKASWSEKEWPAGLARR